MTTQELLLKLHVERNRIDNAISFIEQFQAAGEKIKKSKEIINSLKGKKYEGTHWTQDPKRRKQMISNLPVNKKKRKPMSAAQRKIVSKNMKAYWASVRVSKKV